VCFCKFSFYYALILIHQYISIFLHTNYNNYVYNSPYLYSLHFNPTIYSYFFWRAKRISVRINFFFQYTSFSGKFILTVTVCATFPINLYKAFSVYKMFLNTYLEFSVCNIFFINFLVVFSTEKLYKFFKFFCPNRKTF